MAESDYSSDDMRVVAPQAADELLGIDGVDGSFVLYEIDGVINISRPVDGCYQRSGDYGKTGGGGHHTMAGAQIKGLEIEKVKQMLLEASISIFKRNRKTR